MDRSSTDLGLVPWERFLSDTGTSESKARRLAKVGEFPRPVRIGKKRFAHRDQIQAFVAAKVAAAMAVPQTQ